MFSFAVTKILLLRMPGESYSGTPYLVLQCYKVSSGLISNAVEGTNHPKAWCLLHFRELTMFANFREIVFYEVRVGAMVEITL